MFLIVLILIVLIVPTVLYICFIQGYLLVPLSLGVLLSQYTFYVYWLTFISALAYFDNKTQFKKSLNVAFEMFIASVERIIIIIIIIIITLQSLSHWARRSLSLTHVHAELRLMPMVSLMTSSPGLSSQQIIMPVQSSRTASQYPKTNDRLV